MTFKPKREIQKGIKNTTCCGFSYHQLQDVVVGGERQGVLEITENTQDHRVPYKILTERNFRGYFRFVNQNFMEMGS
ncbi:MAG: hypothetical protein AAGG81_05725 [Chlamydiota bacterium]